MKIQRNKGFTLIELLIVVVIVGILALAAIPLITANTRDARRSEGEQQLGSMKNRVKVAYAKLGSVPVALVGEMSGTPAGCGVTTEELEGKYFVVQNGTNPGSASATSVPYQLVAEPNTSGGGVTSDGSGTGTFDVLNPSGDAIVWAVAAP